MLNRLITDFFVTLKQSEIDYCILRNYSNFPQFTHDIDIYIHPNDISRSIDILLQTFTSEEYYVGEMAAFDNSPNNLHNIKIFRIYHYLSGEALQIDIFQGFSVLAIPIVSFANSRKTYNSVIENHVLSPSVSSLINLFQLKSRIHDKEKYNVYWSNVAANRTEVIEHLKKLGVSDRSLGDLLCVLCDVDKIKELQKLIKKIKIEIIFWNLRRNPRMTVNNLRFRFTSSIVRFFFNTYGTIFWILNEKELAFVRNLIDRKIIPEVNRLKVRDIRVLKKLERGCVYYMRVSNEDFEVRQKIYTRLLGKRLS